MTDKSVALSILDQLGGRRFLIMTGAKNLLAEPNGLTLSIPARMAKNGITGMSITLTADDLYEVEFFKNNWKKRTKSTVSAHSGIGCEQLRELFTRETGLHASF